ncbi:ferritin family protein [Thermococcus sp.]|uniref:ferritin-like domain-containing protein n=1 Tax=Thermococcus sp. TaxID=35749 RepID=UPI0026111C7E|nr:ferritin family protein [Thermococcus sp.]
MDDVVDRLARLPPKEVLGYAIASEEDARNFYKNLTPKCGELLGRFFDDLATAEEGHKKILLKLHERLFGDRNYVVPKGIPLAETAVRVETVANLIEAMQVALVNEKTAERIYGHLKKRLPEHEQIFGFLAAQEKAHYAAIRSHSEYLEDVTQGQPEYINAPVEFFGNQLEVLLSRHKGV